MVLDEPCLAIDEFTSKYSDDPMQRFVASAPSANAPSDNEKVPALGTRKAEINDAKHSGVCGPNSSQAVCSTCGLYKSDVFCEVCGTGPDLFSCQFPFETSQMKLS